ncbi:mitochondrial nicotinamide adenine dinucleotide transporter SLC25A51-like [Centroberyx affinis]|uniref:mitochondrial nicotinamide adenine dinucleotide transporter SLC25A51-like n=1 Tax=Centroberyx affinis TaxID=166261 RepID=UPI003A5C2E39
MALDVDRSRYSRGRFLGPGRASCSSVTSFISGSFMAPGSQQTEEEGGGEGSRRALLPNVDHRKKHYICGSCAAFTNIFITFPIYKVLFRQQLFGVCASEGLRQLQSEGLRNLYRGLLPPLLQKTTTVAIMFGLYEDFSRLLPRPKGAPELLTRSVAAILAGTAEAVLTPFERVQTLLQDPRHHSRFHNTAHTFSFLLRSEHGVWECYRGLVPILLRNGPSNALFFALRGPLKELLPEAQGHATHLLNDFICGGLLGTFLGAMFYPLNVIKSHAQAQVGGRFLTVREVLAGILKEREGRVALLYRGVHLNYHRSILSWGIINATYELLLKVL